jgi:hypothetical protein
LIDGRDQLVIGPDSIHWEHFEFWRPGRKDRKNQPTYFGGTYDWWPEWPDSNDQHPGPSLSIPAAVTFSATNVTLDVIAARWAVQVIQRTNDSPLIVEFDDNGAPGDSWYEVVLHGVTANFSPPLSIAVGSVNLGWSSQTNRTYQLQYTTNVSAGIWINLGTPVQGTGSNIVASDTNLAGPRRFYRLAPVP